MQTQELNAICSDLVELLQNRVPHIDPDLVEFIGMQYFSGSLSRWLSLANTFDKETAQHLDLDKFDLNFKVMIPENMIPEDVELVRKEATQLLADCFDMVVTETWQDIEDMEIGPIN